ncbi:hypothetical protein MMC17_001710 [Xylographa soralifera]|nr:hypothetical protein [Xylographa soralifera]
MEGTTPRASVWEKFLVVPALLLTTVIATILFTTRLDHWASSEGFANFVIFNRSASAILVQVISHILGILHVYALCTTINLSSRAYISARPFSLGFIKFLNAICGNRLDWSLAWHLWLALVMFMISALFPAALWAGALTPVISTRETVQQIALPSYSNITLLAGMPYHSNLRNIYQNNTDKGLFTFAPEFDQQGTMLDQAAGASNRTGGASAHGKMDRSNYVYEQRSYGVGASVGLTDGSLLDYTESYNYYETGFQAETSCIYNSTSDFYLGENILDGSGLILEVFEALGSLPFGNPSINFATAGFNAGGIVALITATSDSRHILAITTGANGSDYYAPLNNVQCEITFASRNFSVAVSRDNQTISVSALEQVAWPPYADKVVDGSVAAISTMAQALATTMYVSILGQTLIYNVANVEAFQGVSNSSKLLGVADAITSLLDNILASYASAQLMVAQEEVPINVDSQVTAIVLGTSAYVFPIFTLNLLICLIYLIELSRTRGWRHLSNFNFMNIKSVIIGTSTGGTAIATKARRLHETPTPVEHGSRSDHDADQILLHLDTTSANVVALTLASDGEKRPFSFPKRSSRQAGDSVFLLQDFSTHNPPVIEPNIVHSGASFSGSFPEHEATNRAHSVSPVYSLDERDVQTPG